MAAVVSPFCRAVASALSAAVRAFASLVTSVASATPGTAAGRMFENVLAAPDIVLPVSVWVLASPTTWSPPDSPCTSTAELMCAFDSSWSIAVVMCATGSLPLCGTAGVPS